MKKSQTEVYDTYLNPPATQMGLRPIPGTEVPGYYITYPFGAWFFFDLLLSQVFTHNSQLTTLFLSVSQSPRLFVPLCPSCYYFQRTCYPPAGFSLTTHNSQLFFISFSLSLFVSPSLRPFVSSSLSLSHLTDSADLFIEDRWWHMYIGVQKEKPDPERNYWE